MLPKKSKSVAQETASTSTSSFGTARPQVPVRASFSLNNLPFCQVNMHYTSAALLFVLVATASVGRTMCQVYYDCEGSALCGSSVNLRKACDDAVNYNIIRNDDVNYGASGSGLFLNGACSTNVPGGSYTGCDVFIQGPTTCTRTGNEIWYDYQDIRNYGCQICGTKHLGGGCLTTIDYTSNCQGQ